MKRYFKYVLGVAILIVACATFALADNSTVATLNGQPYDDVSTALLASTPGDQVTLVSDFDLGSTSIQVPNGVTFNIPAGITLSTSTGSVINKGTTNIYGTVQRLSSSGSLGFVFARQGTLNLYGSVVSSSSYGNAIAASTNDSGIVNIYGGRITGFEYSLLNNSTSGALFNVYGGTFQPMFSSSSGIILADGSQVVGGNNVSWGGLYEIGQIVTNALTWISLFCASIVANKLLLIFIIFFMGFAGIGLIKRIIR